MKRMVRLTFVTLIIFGMGAAAAAAAGGGGITGGYQLGASSLLPAYSTAGAGSGLSYVGGFGYRVNNRGEISGGFGYAVIDQSDQRGIKGGMAGFISGYRILSQPFNLSLVSWTSFGGLYVGSAGPHPNTGYFCVGEELALELGLPLNDKFMPVVYVGYQVSGNVAPGPLFQDYFSCAPTVGVRLAWGKFR